VRFHVVAELTAGRSRNEVARKLSVAVSTVVKVAKRYVEGGLHALFDQRRSNGTSKVDEAFENELRSVLLHSPDEFGWNRSTWTREVLCEELARRGFPRVAVCTMGRALRAVGARLGRAKPIVLCPWPERKRKKRLRQLRRLERRASSAEPVYFVDEVDIDLNPRIGRDWMLRGLQRRIVTPGNNEKHYVAGALNAQTRKLVWVEHHRKSSSLFVKLLWRLAQVHRNAKCIHLIVDNYTIHSSQFTRRVLQYLGGKIRLHFLPPYCPDDNRIERVWRDLHACVTRNHRCRSLVELCERVAGFLDSYDGNRAWNSALNPQLMRAA
jgi:transposase